MPLLKCLWAPVKNSRTKGALHLYYDLAVSLLSVQQAGSDHRTKYLLYAWLLRDVVIHLVDDGVSGAVMEYAVLM